MSDAEKDLWNQQVLRHETWLRTVVRSRVLAVDEADDVLQTVMTTAMAYADRQQEVRAIGPWLYRMALNCVLQFRRKHGRRRKLHDKYSLITTEPQINTPLDLLLGAERQDIVRTALSQMPGDDVEILMLKYVHGWNYHNLCERLGIEHHKVANRLRRARQRLKHEVHQLGLTETENE